MKVLWAVPVIVSIFILSSIMINPVYAAVDEYIILKTQAFEQTGNAAQPTLPADDAFFEAVIDTADGDFAAVNLGGAPAGSPVAFSDFGAGFALFVEFANKGGLDSAYPNGNSYTLDTSGSLGTFSEPITFGTENYPTAVPFFTGNTYNDLQFDPNSDAAINLTWNTPPSGVNFVGLFVEDDTFNQVYFVELADTSVSHTIPAGTLSPGTVYTVNLEWSTDIDDTTTSFPTGNGISGHAFETFIEFTTAADFFFVVGGTSIPIDTTALLLAGVQSISMWMIPILAGIGIGVFVIIRRK